MAQEQEHEQQGIAAPALGVVRFGIPGVPGGQVEIPVSSDPEVARTQIVTALRLATYVAEKYEGTFPAAERPNGAIPQEERTDGRPTGCAAPSGHTAGAPGPQGGGAPAGGAPAYCPEHRDGSGRPVSMAWSSKSKVGDQLFHKIPEAEYYVHPTNRSQVKNHSLYWRETCNAAGVSNENQPAPAGHERPS